ncbi:MAG: hypothetical protein KDE63_12165 [Novosphingobium sp.]|nr:hypothetical protein [Novosphingobium sp.]
MPRALERVLKHGLWALLVTILASSPAQAQPPAFLSQENEVTTDAGYALVDWEAEGSVQLAMAPVDDKAEARTLYSGANKAYFISGLAEGDYYLWLRGDDGSMSEPLKLAVRHQSLAQALWLALVGAIVSLLIVGTIVLGARDD